MVDGRAKRRHGTRPSGPRRLAVLVACLALVASFAELHGPGADHGWPGPARWLGGATEGPQATLLGTVDSIDRSPCHACLHRIHAQASLPRRAGLAAEPPRIAVALHRPPLLPSRLAEEPWSSRGPPA